MGEEISLGERLSALFHKEAAKHRGYYSVSQWSMDVYGIQNQAMSNYMLNKRLPTGENLELFLDVHGAVFFEWMRKPVPPDYDPIKRAVWRRWKNLSPEAREKITQIVEKELAKQPRVANG